MFRMPRAISAEERAAHKAAEAAREAAEFAARSAMPAVPSLGEVLARFWAGEVNEKWTELSDAEKKVRVNQMSRLVRGEANTHYH